MKSFWISAHLFPNLKWKLLLIGTELVFGVNMKAVDNFFSFPMALVWRENDFWFLSYDENTPRRSYGNLMKIQPFSDLASCTRGPIWASRNVPFNLNNLRKVVNLTWTSWWPWLIEFDEFGDEYMHDTMWNALSIGDWWSLESLSLND